MLPAVRIVGMATRMVVSLGHEFNLCRSRPSRQSLFIRNNPHGGGEAIPFEVVAL
jgi:hypothetical protein